MATELAAAREEAVLAFRAAEWVKAPQTSTSTTLEIEVMADAMVAMPMAAMAVAAAKVALAVAAAVAAAWDSASAEVCLTSARAAQEAAGMAAPFPEAAVAARWACNRVQFMKVTKG